MLKINKMADYGLVVMSCFVANAAEPLNAREVAVLTHLSAPTVSKVLKLLAKAGLLISSRGMRGGYGLARAAERITLNQMLEALESDRAMTACAQGPGLCMVEHFCGIRHNWKILDHQFQRTLDGITLADMLKPAVEFKEKLTEIN